MSTLKQIQETIAPELKALNDRIARILHSPNELMNRVICNYLQTKGKQIRPIIVLLSARLCGVIDERVLAAGASVELLHNASLIHDDVVDETKLRRGVQTINGLWDNHLAVLIGDFFVSSSLQEAIATDDIRIIGSIAALGKMLSIGEVDQISNAREHTLDEKAYFDVIYRKTASLFVACAEMGAYAAGAPDSLIEPLREYARLLGLAFQIRDDIFDFYPEMAGEVGKPAGNDLREGKVTLPLLHVLLDATLPRHSAMTQLVQQAELSDEDINELVTYARDNGGIDYAYEVMRAMRDEAMHAVAKLPECQTRQLLADLFDYIIARTN